MRKIKTKAYVQLLDCLGRAVVGRKVYIENRMNRPLSEWFTLTDEAFLLLCLESYVDKWNREWAQAPPADAAPQQQQDGGQEVDNDEARYTGRSQGTKRSWSKEGLERFNGLMVDVFRDRQVNGAKFDVIFREEMIRRYSKQNDSTNPAAGGENEQPAPEKRVVVVYSDFNMEQLMAHTTGASAANDDGEQLSDNDDGEQLSDNDSADERRGVQI